MTAPIAASGRYDQRRPRPIPVAVKDAIALMVVGRADDVDARPLDVVEAAKAVGMTCFVLRRHLDKPHVRAALLAERRRFLAEIVASNPAALKRVRDESRNGMVTVAAARQLEEMNAAECSSRGSPDLQPGVTIRIISPPAAPPMVDVTPNRPVIGKSSLTND